jgi:O-antigen/teichoic acid export membrane protein
MGATLVVAVVGYLAQFIAARVLGPAEYATFAVFWSLVFLVTAFFTGLSQDATRVARQAKLALDDTGIWPVAPARPPFLFVAFGIGLACAVLVALTGALWAPLVGEAWGTPVLLLAATAVLAAGGSTLSGVLAGMARWGTYSLALMLEPVLRLSAFVVVLAVAPRKQWFSVATVVAIAAWLAFPLAHLRTRVELRQVRTDAPAAVSAVRVVQAMVAAGIGGLLVTGLPALIAAAASANPRGATAAGLGVLVLLVVLTRAPLLLPLASFQNVLIARFTGLQSEARVRLLATTAGLMIGGSLLVGVFAGFVGPPLLPILFGHQYAASGWLIGALTAAAAGLGAIALTGAAAVATGRNGAYLLGWGLAIILSVAALFLLPLPIEWATVVAVAGGPMLGSVGHLIALTRKQGVAVTRK